jgi:hypothetical protein
MGGGGESSSQKLLSHMKYKLQLRNDFIQYDHHTFQELSMCIPQKQSDLFYPILPP